MTLKIARQIKHPLRLRLVLPIMTAALFILPGTSMAATAATTRPTTPLNLATSPLPITLEAVPGQTVTAPIKVKQSGSPSEQLTVTLLKFGADGTTGKPVLSSFGPGDIYQNWVSFDKTNFMAPDNVWQTITMTIRIPKTAAFEYNYAVEVTRLGDQLAPGGLQEAIAGGTATLVLLNVNSPGARRSMELKTFAVEHRVVEFLPTTFDATFFNNGNVYLQPQGDIFITQAGHQVGIVNLNDEDGNILANTYRDYQVAWADGFPFYTPENIRGKPQLDRHGNRIMQLDWDLPTNATEALTSSTASTTNVAEGQESNNVLSRLRFGKYTARLVAVYEDNYGRDVPITSQITFWVIPWRILIAFLVILAVFGFAIYTVIRNLVRRHRRLEHLAKKRRPY